MSQPIYPGNWLAQLNNKRIAQIYQVDFSENRHTDGYYPWLFFIIFEEVDQLLELEGDFDGDHIRVNFYPLSELDTKIKENNYEGQPDLWKVFPCNQDDLLSKICQKDILKIEYGVEKDVFVINGTSIKGKKDLFTFIRFYVNDAVITIFEGGGGLYVSDDSHVELNFPETFNIYSTG